MNDRDPFARIVASLHEASLDDARWPAASDLIDDVLCAAGNTLGFGGGAPEEGIQVYFTGVFGGGQRFRELEREYFRDYYHRDERMPRLHRLPDSKVLPIRNLYTHAELKTSATYNEFLVRGAQKGLNVRLDGPGGTRIIWVVHDPRDAEGWSSARIELVQRLLPHIRHYVTVRQVLAGAKALGASLGELLENTGPGVIQLDGRGRIVDANDRARESLRADNGLFDAGGFLFARSPADNAALQELLARALPPFGRQGTGGSMALTPSPGRNPVELHVNPVGQQEASMRAWPVAALVLVVEAEEGLTVVNPDLVAVRLGLTQAESRVAVMLAEGRSVRDIADSTGRRISTIRTHVHRIFRKTRITKQADLVRLVLGMSGSSRPRL